ncbi:hypothetical protein [Frigoribacterium sp. PvP032]|uniref:hypothetical protein n=1 Tax=Frigoribacterium sp. PvP032 TaxID=2806589 RepID=UPI001AE102E1|nr:hypothetical protein [Frigoribacterium sp. PvP032]MBP1189477.1 hypothetical protein [Frigoribacterium sp. PvP032]
MLLEPNDLANLLAVRNLRNLAASHARIPGRAQHDTAVLLLDAAIERAVFTACGFKQIDLGVKDTLESALSKLGNTGFTTPAGLSTDRMRLHKARNGVQHSGLSVDPGSVPTWVVTTDKFITHVVTYAYGVDIDDVRLSTAIRDPEIKAHLDAAEARLDADDTTAAVSAISEAYKIARKTWNRFVESSQMFLRHRTRPYSASLSGDDGDQIKALQQVTFVTSIAPDPAEAIWFLAALREQTLLTTEEARRALAFAFTFATAVEASPAVRRENRRNVRDQQARHVRADPAAHTRLGPFSLNPDGWRGIAEITITLIDVPGADEFNGWSRLLNDLINPRGNPSEHIYVNDDGTIRFYADSDTESTLTRIEEAVAAVDGTFETRKAEEAAATHARETGLRQAQDRLNEMMDALPEWIRLYAIEGGHSDAGPEVVLNLTPPLRGNLPYRELADAISGSGDVGLSNTSHGLTIQTDLDDIPELLTSLVPALEALLAEAQAKEADDAAAVDALEQKLLKHGLRPH